MKKKCGIGTLLVALAGLLTVGVPVLAFSAAPAMAIAPVPVCSSETTAISGSYHNLTIFGKKYVADGASLSVSGNLVVAPRACLDAFSPGKVNVGGNILLVGKGGTLALGCSPGALGPPLGQAPCNGRTTHDTVGGNIIAEQALTMYLTADTIGGNVTSIGGGPGLGKPFVNFPIKENQIGGNLTVLGWHGGWAGALRNNVGGNLIFSKNVSVLDKDSNEVVTNTIGGNLSCYSNFPAVQFADSGGSPNTVGGQKLGQCAGL